MRAAHIFDGRGRVVFRPDTNEIGRWAWYDAVRRESADHGFAVVERRLRSLAARNGVTLTDEVRHVHHPPGNLGVTGDPLDLYGTVGVLIKAA